LASRLENFRNDPDAIVIAIPHGGVEVAFSVATALELPLDILSVQRIGLPGNEQLTMGAISSGGVCVLKSELVERAGLPPEVIEAIAYRELRDMERKETLYRSVRPEAQVHGLDVILVDDGLLTGATMLAAVRDLRKKMAASITIASPLAAAGCESDIGPEADRFVVLHTPSILESIGDWYLEFDKVKDHDITDMLGKVRHLQLGVPSRLNGSTHSAAGDFPAR
jgi:predicted phosphoribosyltransferase